LRWIASRTSPPQARSKTWGPPSSPALPNGASRDGGVNGSSMRATSSARPGSSSCFSTVDERQYSEMPCGLRRPCHPGSTPLLLKRPVGRQTQRGRTSPVGHLNAREDSPDDCVYVRKWEESRKRITACHGWGHCGQRPPPSAFGRTGGTYRF